MRIGGLRLSREGGSKWLDHGDGMERRVDVRLHARVVQGGAREEAAKPYMTRTVLSEKDAS